ncbi:MAG TPA: hypothetical protein VFT43_05445 [Candidatus Polarisedimenticolia bacterium]|nr:hypothetical protein [Candidatus Polarisedimenticolia bacterium]
MRVAQRAFSIVAAAGLMPGLLCLAGESPASPPTDPGALEVIDQSPGLLIYRVLDRNGRPTVVLTNLDQFGRFLPGRQVDAAAPPGPACEPIEAIQKTSAPDEPRDGTTIVININNPPEPPAAPAPVVVYSVLAVGGAPGTLRYPDHQPFLGYGTGIRSPSWFGGLGLNAGNHFGLKTGKSCELGFDCLFGP